MCGHFSLSWFIQFPQILSSSLYSAIVFVLLAIVYGSVFRPLAHHISLYFYIRSSFYFYILYSIFSLSLFIYLSSPSFSFLLSLLFSMTVTFILSIYSRLFVFTLFRLLNFLSPVSVFKYNSSLFFSSFFCEQICPYLLPIFFIYFSKYSPEYIVQRMC